VRDREPPSLSGLLLRATAVLGLSACIRLLKVDRATVYRWMNDKHAPHELTADGAKLRLSRALKERATLVGNPPLPVDLDEEPAP
jgi:hypothetical protein